MKQKVVVVEGKLGESKEEILNRILKDHGEIRAFESEFCYKTPSNERFLQITAIVEPIREQEILWGPSRVNSIGEVYEYLGGLKENGYHIDSYSLVSSSLLSGYSVLAVVTKQD